MKGEEPGGSGSGLNQYLSLGPSFLWTASWEGFLCPFTAVRMSRESIERQDVLQNTDIYEAPTTHSSLYLNMKRFIFEKQKHSINFCLRGTRFVRLNSWIMEPLVETELKANIKGRNQKGKWKKKVDAAGTHDLQESHSATITAFTHSLNPH